jgi:hypothetical protein
VNATCFEPTGIGRGVGTVSNPGPNGRWAAPPDETVLEAQIAATNRQIDRLRDDLHGLTEEATRG